MSQNKDFMQTAVTLLPKREKTKTNFQRPPAPFSDGIPDPCLTFVLVNHLYLGMFYSIYFCFPALPNSFSTSVNSPSFSL